MRCYLCDGPVYDVGYHLIACLLIQNGYRAAPLLLRQSEYWSIGFVLDGKYRCRITYKTDKWYEFNSVITTHHYESLKQLLLHLKILLPD